MVTLKLILRTRRTFSGEYAPLGPKGHLESLKDSILFSNMFILEKIFQSVICNYARLSPGPYDDPSFSFFRPGFVKWGLSNTIVKMLPKINLTTTLASVLQSATGKESLKQTFISITKGFLSRQGALEIVSTFGFPMLCL